MVVVDLVGACRAFVHVSDQGGFTRGAVAAGMSQPVASRKIAALEKHLGEPLFERAMHGAPLTHFGRDMLPVARRLVRAAENLEFEADNAKRRVWRLAMPSVATGDVAVLLSEARGHGMALDVRTGHPARRMALLRDQEVRAAVVAVAPSEATWTVPLGLASASDLAGRRVHLDTLRPSRSDNGQFRRIWLQPEDDVPHVRDRVRRACEAAGLLAGQLVAASSTAAAAAQVLGTGDLLLCSRAQAEELGLRWRPVGEIDPVRGFAISAADTDADRLISTLSDEIARCLGVPVECGAA